MFLYLCGTRHRHHTPAPINTTTPHDLQPNTTQQLTRVELCTDADGGWRPVANCARRGSASGSRSPFAQMFFVCGVRHPHPTQAPIHTQIPQDHISCTTQDLTRAEVCTDALGRSIRGTGPSVATQVGPFVATQVVRFCQASVADDRSELPRADD
jgi:hypothetical protein